jgi:Protein kinase domain
MASSDDLGQLDSGEWAQLLEVVDRAETAMKEQVSVDLNAFLPPPGSPKRFVYLCELIKTEMEIRYRQKRGQPLEFYVERHPELGSLEKLPAGLIYEEFLVRQQHGDRPPLVNYQVRFPGQFDAFLRLLDEREGGAVQETKAPRGRVSVANTLAGKEPSRLIVKPGEQFLPVGGGYRLLDRLGGGAFGEVYRALAPNGELTAVKWLTRPLDDRTVQRELESLRTLSELRHQYLLRTREHHQLNGRLVLIMDLAEGSLSDRLEQCREGGLDAIPVDELLPYFRQAAEGLDFLHQNKVTHRDIKPQNLLFLKGRVQLADFGLAREQDGSTAFTSLICGTPAYMPPETWQNKISFRSDQYSLAAAYVEMRLGRPVYSAVSLYEIRQCHLRGTPDLAPLEGEERKVLLRALARDPHHRFPTCGAFVKALSNAVRPAPSNPSRFPVKWAVVVAAVVVVAFLLFWLWLR